MVCEWDRPCWIFSGGPGIEMNRSSTDAKFVIYNRQFHQRRHFHRDFHLVSIKCSQLTNPLSHWSSNSSLSKSSQQGQCRKLWMNTEKCPAINPGSFHIYHFILILSSLQIPSQDWNQSSVQGQGRGIRMGLKGYFFDRSLLVNGRLPLVIYKTDPLY